MLSNLQMTLQFWQQMALPTFCITSGTQHVSTIVFSACNSITHSCQQKTLSRFILLGFISKYMKLNKATQQPTSHLQVLQHAVLHCSIGWHLACVSLKCKIQHKLAFQLWHAFAERLECDTLSTSLRHTTCYKTLLSHHISSQLIQEDQRHLKRFVYLHGLLDESYH